MKTEYIVGNLITGDCNIFCHQVNCKGAMGAGIAKAIRAVYPEVYREFRKDYLQGNAKRGNILCVPTHDNRYCINMYAQYGYGYGLQTDYEAFKECLRKLSYLLNNVYDESLTVGFPAFIGCGLAGGDWSVVRKMIDEFAETVPQRVFIVRLAK